jgi:hypothetical protein
MLHVAIALADDAGSVVTWGEPVADEEYAGEAEPG